MKTRLALIFAVLSTGAFTCAHAIQPGDPAPNFTLTDLTGQPHSLADYKGKFVILEWNNPECPFVHKHYDSGNMAKLQQEAESKGVIWLTINSAAPGKDGDDDTAKIQNFLKGDHASPTAYLRDPQGKVGRLYSAKTTPDMYVINSDGKLVYEGAIDNRPTPDPSDIPGATNYVREALDASLAGKPVAVANTRPYGCSVKY
jgi:hypothetical protein